LDWAGVGKVLSANPVGKKLLGRSATDVAPKIVAAAFTVTKAAVTAEKPAYNDVALDNGDYAVIMVSAVQSGASVADAAATLPQLRQQRMAKTGAAEFALYMTELERTAKIKRNPTAFE
jgi:hypothetical protein